jgi:predicted ABC-type ATPase
MMGGHDVPIQKIISRYYKSIANCALLAPVVDRLYVYDNSTDNAFPELLFRAGNGRLMKQYAATHDWAKIVYQAISV